MNLLPVPGKGLPLPYPTIGSSPPNPVSRDINSQTCEKKKAAAEKCSKRQKKMLPTKRKQRKGQKTCLCCHIGRPSGRFRSLWGRSWQLFGRSWVVWGRSWPLLARSWDVGASWAPLGRLLDLLDASWTQLGKIPGSGITLLDIFWGGLGPLFRIFSYFFRIFWASYVTMAFFIDFFDFSSILEGFWEGFGRVWGQFFDDFSHFFPKLRFY